MVNIISLYLLGTWTRGCFSVKPFYIMFIFAFSFVLQFVVASNEITLDQ